MRIPVALPFAVTVGLLAAGLAGCGGSSGSSSTAVAGAGAGTTSGAPSAVKTVTRTATAITTPTGTATATGTATIGSTTPQASSTASGTACRAAGLALSFLGRQGATGHGELGFALRNTGSAACATIGYPGVQFLDRHGAALPTVPTRTTHDFFGTVPLRPLVLAPAQTASFRLGVTHGAGSGAGCTTADALQVIAPNDTATLRVAIPDGTAECGTATVSPLRSGTLAYP